MSLADPQSIKISGTTTSLPRVSTGDYKSKYESADGLIDLTVSTQNGKRKRQVARIDISKVTADPFIPAQNIEVSSSFQLVVDRPLAGFTNTEASAIVAGFIEALTKEESKIITKLLAGES
jgi:hypothetical protein